MCRFRVNEHLIVIYLYTDLINTILVMEIITLKFHTCVGIG